MKTNVFVKTKNVKKFVGLMEDLKKLPPNIPRLALVYGDHGIGKTQEVHRELSTLIPLQNV